MKRRSEATSLKPKHGSPNPIFLSEHASLLAAVDRALSSSTNAQIIGRNGEIPLRDFLGRYLPFTLKVATGHFISPAGHISPQIDIMLLDARYPLLAENPDGSVLAMMHAVLNATEVKTRMTNKDLRIGWENAVSIMKIASEIDGYGGGTFSAIRTDAVAYRLAQRLESSHDAYVNAANSGKAGFDVYILSVPDREQPRGASLGAELHMEPTGKRKFEPTCRLSHTMLGDFYYRLIQDAYYTLSARKWRYEDIGRQIMDYMEWATCSWETYEKLMRQNGDVA